jgi:dolichol kinase
VPSEWIVESSVVLLWLVTSKLLGGLLTKAVNRGALSPGTIRKTAHVVTGLWVIAFAKWIHNWWIVLIPISLIFLASQRANVNRLGSSKKWMARYSPFITVIAPILLTVYFWKQGRTDLVVPAVLVMTFGDTAAYFAGIYFGKHKFALTGKSYEGALANFAVSFTVLILTSQFLTHEIRWIPAVIIAFVCAALELVLPGGWDNPIVVMAALLLMRWVPARLGLP